MSTIGQRGSIISKICCIFAYFWSASVTWIRDPPMRGRATHEWIFLDGGPDSHSVNVMQWRMQQPAIIDCYFYIHHLYRTLLLILVVYSWLDRAIQPSSHGNVAITWKWGEGVAYSIHYSPTYGRYCFANRLPLYIVTVLLNLSYVSNKL